MPRRAPTPHPTMTATGVANPNAHGQLMTNTVIARASDRSTLCPADSHAAKVRAAKTTTTGTKTAAALSAMRANGALLAAASETRRTICAKAVLSPTRTARQRIKPDVLSVPAETEHPAVLSMGRLSPVSADSSTALSPSKTVPSAGILPPGRTMKTSSGRTSVAGTVSSRPPRRTTAVSGANAANFFKAFVVLPFEIDSSSLPTVISVGIIAAVSK